METHTDIVECARAGHASPGMLDWLSNRKHWEDMPSSWLVYAATHWPLPEAEAEHVSALTGGRRSWWIRTPLGRWVRHREDGPALVIPGDRAEWWHLGRRHRDGGGPAVMQCWDGIMEWWWHGTYIRTQQAEIYATRDRIVVRPGGARWNDWVAIGDTHETR
jgi:hypothetical protein